MASPPDDPRPHSPSLHPGTTAWTATRAGAGAPGDLLVPGLTILWHPNVERVGERAALPALASQRTVELSRLEPQFSPAGTTRRRPLGDRHLSRSPLRLIPTGRGLRLERTRSPIAVAVDGTEVIDDHEIDATTLAEGVTLLLGRRVLLLLHPLDPAPPATPHHGLVGESPAMVALRRDIDRLLDLDLPVLLRGETGTGKELVARALHESGPRRRQPFVAVDMASLTPTLAAAELFGAERGAYTGAERRREGHFRRADGGSLFLDEIGETPPEVQALLLRTLETRQVRAVGGEHEVGVDVRLIAATDADLETAVEQGDFRAPLLHRLSGYVLHLPPLRARRDDIARLFLHRLQLELARLGLDRRLELGDWLAAPLLEPLIGFDWPGNVRQLANVVRQLVVRHRDDERVQEIPLPERRDGAVRRPIPRERSAPERREPAAGEASARASGRRRPADIREEELIGALRAARWRPRQAAEALGIAPASIYGLIDKTPRLRKASELDRPTLLQALEAAENSVERAAEALEVSEQALRRQMGRLGLDSRA